jgi:hypothetical protein
MADDFAGEQILDARERQPAFRGAVGSGVRDRA